MVTNQEYGAKGQHASLLNCSTWNRSDMLGGRQIPEQELGDLVRRLRESKKLTQEGLASLAGIHRNSLRAIEKGRSEPEAETLRRIEAALEVESTVLSRRPLPFFWELETTEAAVLQGREVNRVADPDHPEEGGQSPAEQLLEFLSQRLGHRRVAGELTDKDLIAAAYTLARKHGFTPDDYRILDRWRDQIIQAEKG